MSGLGALVKTAKAARKAEPFYSAVDEAAQALTRGKGTGKEFMIEVLKKPGVKPTEIKERGLQKIEAMPKMTKEEFLAELEKRPAQQIEEKVISQPSMREIEERASEMAYDEARVQARANGYRGEQLDEVADEIHEDILNSRDSFDEYLERAREDLDTSGIAPQHEDWTLPGG